MRKLSQQNFTEPQEDQPSESPDKVYPSTTKLIFIEIGLALAVFLYGLDGTIITTAIPRITDAFGALEDVGWYGAAYYLTSSAFQLLFGKMYTILSVKAVYFGAIGLFELGSLVCATAPNSPALIVGRALAGIGAAGLYSGSVIILSHSAPLAKRGLLTGLLAAALGIASIVGPFLGGAFTDKLSWRWCFYINLPLGAVAVVLVAFFIKIPRDPEYASLKPVELLAKLDMMGMAVLIASIICLLLALQWGGVTYAWHNARIIVLLILAILLGIGFILVEKYTPKTRTVSRSLFRSRSIGFATWYGGCIFAAFTVTLYYLPIWFQGVEQVSAFESGKRSISLILGFLVFGILSGALTNAFGYYTPLMIIASILTSVGAGLLTTLSPSSRHPQWIGYQALFGFGIGFGIQHPLLVIQTVLSEKEVPVGITLITLIQSLFSAIFVAVGQNVFQNQLARNVRAVIPDFNANSLIRAGATRLAEFVPAQDLPAAISAYSKAIDQTLYITVAVSALSMIGALGTEWKSVKKEDPMVKKADDEKDADESPQRPASNAE
ncbi:MFS general substrate transporter [Viridothelium virens]|uniref:MFS general substrate transporter n=1 Tax=Viridothelium virens TaxID=1048519 RepID=A0A6A6HAX4_VIRVR|nr:MFS general substrate transporter [Viridothelium virens]